MRLDRDLVQPVETAFLLRSGTVAPTPVPADCPGPRQGGLARIEVGSSTLAGSLAGMLLNPLRASSKSFTRRTGERLRLRIYARTDFRTRDLPTF